MNYWLHILITLEIYLLLALAMNLLAGFSGLLSLGQAALYGIGAYAYALATGTLGLGHGLAVWAAIGITVLASVPMMGCAIRLRGLFFALSPHPAGGDALQHELQPLISLGYGHVASLLEPDEAAQLHLADEAVACARAGLRFHHLPVRDGAIPGFARYVAFMESLAEALADGRGLLVHCRHGIGRSGMVAIGLLLRGGMPFQESVRTVANARGVVLPATPAQHRLLLAYAQEHSRRASQHPDVQRIATTGKLRKTPLLPIFAPATGTG